jgi:hypothetical protein
VLGFTTRHTSLTGVVLLHRDEIDLMIRELAPAAVTGPSPKLDDRWDVYIRVEDVRRFCSSVQKNLGREVSITETASGFPEFRLTDPDGHVLVFGEIS